jgi:predicted outer membrane repeat protein
MSKGSAHIASRSTSKAMSIFVALVLIVSMSFPAQLASGESTTTESSQSTQIVQIESAQSDANVVSSDDKEDGEGVVENSSEAESLDDFMSAEGADAVGLGSSSDSVVGADGASDLENTNSSDISDVANNSEDAGNLADDTTTATMKQNKSTADETCKDNPLNPELTPNPESIIEEDTDSENTLMEAASAVMSETYILAAASDNSEPSAVSDDAITFTNDYWRSNSGVLTSGIYRLQSDVCLTGNPFAGPNGFPNTSFIYIRNGQNVTIDLNGHTLTTQVKGYRVLDNQGTLTVCDASGKAAGAITDCSNPSGNAGAIYSKNTLTVRDVKFDGNYANQGGAIYSSGSLVLQNVTFTNNESKGAGGAVFDSATLDVRSCTFTNNTAGGSGGAVYMKTGSAYSITGATVVEGNSAQDGGGLYLSASAGKVARIGSDVVSADNVVRISGNSATNTGGGLFLTGSNKDITVKNVRIKNNTAGQNGGGIYFGASGSDSQSLELTDGTQVSGNRAKNLGGGIYSYNSGNKITLNNVTIGSTDVAIYWVKYAQNAEDVVVCQGATAASVNPDSASTKGVYIEISVLLELTESEFIAKYGEGYIAYNMGDETFETQNKNQNLNPTSGTYYDYLQTLLEAGGNVATYDGGGIYNNAGSVTATNSIIAGNHVMAMAGHGGGGVTCNLASTSFVMQGCKVVGNSTLGSGGAFYYKGTDGSDVVTQSAVFQTRNSRIDFNYARRYGGAYRMRATADLYGGTSSFNTADISGGSLSVEDKSPVVIHSGIYNCNSATTNADYNNELSNDSMVYVVGNGGAIRCVGELTVEGGTFSKNRAWRNGGALYSLTDYRGYSGNRVSSISVKGGTFTSNIARQNGGGAAINSVVAETVELSITGGTFTNNKALNTYVNPKTKAVVTDGGEGGAIFITATKPSGSTGDSVFKCTINSCEISTNQARNGAGIAINVGEGETRVNGQVELGLAPEAMTGKDASMALFIHGNSATQDGGGIYVSGGTTNFYSGEICDNVAGQNGGGIIINDGSMSIAGGTLSYNIAGKHGGGVAVLGKKDGLQSLNISEANSQNPILITQNMAGKVPSSEVGSKIDEHTLTRDVDDSSTGGSGGGIFVNWGNVVLSGGEISYNSAVNWSVVENLDDNAYGNGGGICLRDGSFTITACRIEGNECSRFGGGIYLSSEDYRSGADYKEDADKSTQMLFSGGDVINNHAAQGGGGICATYSNVRLARASANVDLSGEYSSAAVHITGNEACVGGGVFMRYSSTLTMEGGRVDSNHAVSLASEYAKTSDLFKPLVDINLKQQSRITDEGGLGGGIYLINSKINVTGRAESEESGSISYNVADSDGGGVFVARIGLTTVDSVQQPVEVSVTNGSISFNTSSGNGGGIAMLDTVHEGTIAAMTVGGRMKISKNTAVNGGAIYVSGGQLDVTGGLVTDNSAVGNPSQDVKTAYTSADNRGVGGGLYVCDTGTLVIDTANYAIAAAAEDEEGVASNSSASKHAVGVYSNLADFAADDVYCSFDTSSEIYLPQVADMALDDFEGHMIGKAEGWYEDYAVGDTQYSYGLNGKEVSKGTVWGVRYRSAENSDKFEFKPVTDNSGAIKPVSGYTCLTLGYSLTRMSVSVGKTLVGALAALNQGATFTFRMTIDAKLSEIEQKQVEFDKSYEYNHVYFENHLSKVTKAGSQVALDLDSEEYFDSVAHKGTATLKFTLAADEFAVIEGIPCDAEITVEETDIDPQSYSSSYSGVATSTFVVNEVDAFNAYTEHVASKYGNDSAKLFSGSGASATVSVAANKVTKDALYGNNLAILFSNTALSNGLELPDVGGCGVVWLTALCVALYTLAFALCRKRVACTKLRRAGRGQPIRPTVKGVGS